MSNLFNNLKDEMTKPNEEMADMDYDIGRPAIDVVYDALVGKVEYYGSLIRDAESDIKHWKEMKSEFEMLIKAIDRRK